MEFKIDQIELLLLLAATVAMVCRKFNFPYTVGLVLAGVSMSFLPVVPTLHLTTELLFSTLLPPLIFEAAMLLPWQALRKELPLVLLMASVGLLVAALLTALGMYYGVGWPLLPAAIFGVLIAATDPVSVIATFKDVGVKGRLRLLVESESLFNDGTAAVVFALLLAMVQGSAPTVLGLLGNTLWIVLGGLLCGGGLAWLILLLAGRTDDHLVEITLTTVIAYGSFLLAEHFHFSGVLATLTAGLVVGYRIEQGTLSEKGREVNEEFWEFAAFVANSLVFLLIGLREAQQHFGGLWGAIALAIALVTVGRAVVVYPTAWLFAKTNLQVPRPFQHILFWGGLRGALALALALGLPDAVPFREQIVTVSFAVVAFSVIVQGLTMPPLLRRLGLLPK